MEITAIKGVRVSDKHYTVDMDHEAFCKLQTLLTLVHNTGPRMTEEDRNFCKQFNAEIQKARLQDYPAFS